MNLSMGYSPLGRGFLAGAAPNIGDDDYRCSQPRWQGEALSRKQAMADALAAFATAKRCTLAQLSLAWLLHRGPDVVPLPGTTRLHRLKENIATASISLSADDMADRLMLAAAVAGNRYDAGCLSLIEH